MSHHETCLCCQTEIDWDSSDDQRGTIWGCDNCSFYFCEACFRERHGAEALHDMVSAESEEEILCPDCYQKKGEKEMDEKEFGTEEWAKELIESLGEMQHNGTGECFPCPRCGHDRMDDVMVRNALSRYADVYICSQCGTDEALRDMAGKGPLPFLEWGMPMGFVNNGDDEDGDDDE